MFRSILLVSAAVLSLASSSGAYAGNSSSIVQNGNGNGASTFQRGRDNDSQVIQFGNGNGALVTQRGRNNNAGIGQNGDFNFGAVDQRRH
jgi:hypothetical protein